MTTSSLLETLKRAAEGEPQITEKLQEERRVYLNQCLFTIWKVLRSSWGKDLDHNIRSSVLALCETVSSVVHWTMGKSSLELSALDWTKGYYNKVIQDLMFQRGWCPSDVTRISETFKSVQTLYLLPRMEKLPARDHTSCTPNNCQSYQINRADYEVGHVRHGTSS